MTYVFYDLAKIETMMRRLHVDQLATQKATSRTVCEFQRCVARERFLEPMISCQIEMIRLMNEGRDAAFIGNTIGNVVGNLLVNTLAASADQTLCLEHINHTVNNALGVLAEDVVAGVNFAKILVQGTAGGRA